VAGSHTGSMNKPHDVSNLGGASPLQHVVATGGVEQRSWCLGDLSIALAPGSRTTSGHSGSTSELAVRPGEAEVREARHGWPAHVEVYQAFYRARGPEIVGSVAAVVAGSDHCQREGAHGKPGNLDAKKWRPTSSSMSTHHGVSNQSNDGSGERHIRANDHLLGATPGGQSPEVMRQALRQFSRTFHAEEGGSSVSLSGPDRASTRSAFQNLPPTLASSDASASAAGKTGRVATCGANDKSTRFFGCKRASQLTWGIGNVD